LKELVRTGGEGDYEGNLQAIAGAALGCGMSDADAAMAVMIAESLKAVPTTLSLQRGVPFQPARQENSATGEGAPSRLMGVDPRRPFLERRENLRLEAMWRPEQGEVIARQIEEIDAQLGELRREMSHHDHRFARWCDATFLDVARPDLVKRSLRNLGPNSTLLGWQSEAEAIWSYVFWDGGQLINRRPMSRDEQVKLKHVDMEQLVLSEEQLQSLGAILLEPVAARLRDLCPSDRLIISTCAPFEGLPFAALPFLGKRLCERAILTVVQGLGILEACTQRLRSRHAFAVCLGAPKRPDLEDLPDALREIDQVEHLLRSHHLPVIRLVGQDATVSGLKKHASECDILHLACHAAPGGPTSEPAKLFLSPEPSIGDSGVLSDDRIVAELTLQEGAMVNLSACSTAPFGNAGEFFFSGLMPAFLVAGANSVIGTLWDIDDTTTALFQSAFYEALTEGTASQALAITQRRCITGRLGIELRQTDVWGAFVAYGAA
jgi:CHAT domain-containing protein